MKRPSCYLKYFSKVSGETAMVLFHITWKVSDETAIVQCSVISTVSDKKAVIIMVNVIVIVIDSELEDSQCLLFSLPSTSSIAVASPDS